jgi:hypothetical protein
MKIATGIATTLVLAIVLVCVANLSSEHLDFSAETHDNAQQHAVKGGAISKQAVHWDHDEEGADAEIEEDQVLDRIAYFQHQGTKVYHTIYQDSERRLAKGRGQVVAEEFFPEEDEEEDEEEIFLQMDAAPTSADAATAIADASAFDDEAAASVKAATKLHQTARKAIARDAPKKGDWGKSGSPLGSPWAANKVKKQAAEAKKKMKIQNAVAKEQKNEALAEQAALQAVAQSQTKAQEKWSALQTQIAMNKAQQTQRLQEEEGVRVAALHTLQDLANAARAKEQKAKEKAAAIVHKADAKASQLLSAAKARIAAAPGIKAGATQAKLQNTKMQLKAAEKQLMDKMTNTHQSDATNGRKQLVADQEKANMMVQKAKNDAEAEESASNKVKEALRIQLRDTLWHTRSKAARIRNAAAEDLYDHKMKAQRKLRHVQEAVRRAAKAATKMPGTSAAEVASKWLKDNPHNDDELLSV